MKRKKERIIMAVSAVMVLSTLTAAGLWMGSQNGVRDEGEIVDLTTIEENVTAELAKKQEELSNTQSMEKNLPIGQIPEDDLDYDPFFQETNSDKVENPDESGSTSMSADVKDNMPEKPMEEDVTTDKSASKEVDEPEEALSTAMQPTLDFTDEDTLVWPISGNVLVNYSMDKTIYFPTLDQYKYNPAIIIAASEGDLISAAAAGKVISVEEDREIGNRIVMELGSGYEVTYGQLTNILVSEGSYVEKGDVIAEVAAPTKYFSVEGTNVYFKLTKDGVPVNPMAKLN